MLASAWTTPVVKRPPTSLDTPGSATAALQWRTLRARWNAKITSAGMR